MISVSLEQGVVALAQADIHGVPEACQFRKFKTFIYFALYPGLGRQTKRCTSAIESNELSANRSHNSRVENIAPYSIGDTLGREDAIVSGFKYKKTINTQCVIIKPPPIRIH